MKPTTTTTNGERHVNEKRRDKLAIAVTAITVAAAGTVTFVTVTDWTVLRALVIAVPFGVLGDAYLTPNHAELDRFDVQSYRAEVGRRRRLGHALVGTGLAVAVGVPLGIGTFEATEPFGLVPSMAAAAAVAVFVPLLVAEGTVLLLNRQYVEN